MLQGFCDTLFFFVFFLVLVLSFLEKCLLADLNRMIQWSDAAWVQDDVGQNRADKRGKVWIGSKSPEVWPKKMNREWQWKDLSYIISNKDNQDLNVGAKVIEEHSDNHNCSFCISFCRSTGTSWPKQNKRPEKPSIWPATAKPDSITMHVCLEEEKYFVDTFPTCFF